MISAKITSGFLLRTIAENLPEGRFFPRSGYVSFLFPTCQTIHTSKKIVGKILAQEMWIAIRSALCFCSTLWKSGYLLWINIGISCSGLWITCVQLMPRKIRSGTRIQTYIRLDGNIQISGNADRHTGILSKKYRRTLLYGNDK